MRPHRGSFFSGTDKGPLLTGASLETHPQGRVPTRHTRARHQRARRARSGPRRCSQAAGQPGSVVGVGPPTGRQGDGLEPGRQAGRGHLRSTPHLPLPSR